jgi:hypothetical protein
MIVAVNELARVIHGMGRGGWLAVVVLLALAGCAPVPAPQDEVAWEIEDGAVWCYRTLADVDCLARPEPGAAHRLVAVGPRRSFLPALADPEVQSQLPTAEGDGPIQLVPAAGGS